MKCILYISKVAARQDGAVIPRGFSEIFRVARKNNAQNKITGALSYRNGHYIQILEGEELVVDQLFSKISNDRRHEEVTVLINQSIVKRSFPDWDMKLPQSVHRDPEFIRFFKASGYAISSLDRNKRTLLELFYNTTNTASTSLWQAYKGKDLKLTAWPDFNSIKPSPVVIELSARLTKKQCSYSSLCDGREFGTAEQLDKILRKFESLGVLDVTTSVGRDPSIDDLASTNKTNGFYSKMKQFLGMR